MKKIVDKYIPALIEKVGVGINPLLLNFRQEQRRLLVFYFHGLYQFRGQQELNHVDPQNNFTVEAFAEFIDYFLQHNYRFIQPEALLHGLSADQPYAMITFDDGYFNNILALDVLQQYEVPATFYITSGNVQENQSYWWDIVYKYRKKQGQSLEVIRQEQEQLKHFKTEYICQYIRQTFGKEALKPWSDIDRPFTVEELRKFAKNQWVHLGNHTATHAILTNCNRQEIQEELLTCNQFLKDVAGKLPVSTAFPNGSFNDLVLDVARAAGFQFALTTEARSNPLPAINQGFVRLDRFMAQPENIQQYGRFCRMGYTPDAWYDNWKNKVKHLKIIKTTTTC